MRLSAVTLALVLAATLGPVALARSGPGGDPGVLNGVYGLSWGKQELMARGVSASYARHNYGSLRWTLHDGEFTLLFSVPPPVCRGTYTVSGHTVRFMFQAGCD